MHLRLASLICWFAPLWLSGDSDTTSLAPGAYEYPFEFLLLPDLPSSFEGEFGYVRYTAQATIDRPWKFDHVTKEAFTVIAFLDLNHEPLLFRVWIATFSSCSGFGLQPLQCSCGFGL